MSEFEQLIDPDDLVIVTYDEPIGHSNEVLAMSCSYVPATTKTGNRVIVLEVLWDPAFQAPQTAYYCPAGRLKRVLIAPNRVRRVRPYLGD